VKRKKKGPVFFEEAWKRVHLGVDSPKRGKYREKKRKNTEGARLFFLRAPFCVFRDPSSRLPIPKAVRLIPRAVR